AAAAVAAAGAVRGLLRRGGAGLLRRRGPGGRDRALGRRHRAAGRAGQRQRRLLHRMGAEGAGLDRAGRQPHERRADLPAVGDAAGRLRRRRHHLGRGLRGQAHRVVGVRQRVGDLRGDGRRGSGLHDGADRHAGLQHERLPAGRHRRRAGDDLQRVGAGAGNGEPRHGRALPAGGLRRHRLPGHPGGMLQDAIWADTARLEEEDYAATTVALLKAVIRGWAYARDEVQSAAEITLAAGSTWGPSHELWMANETNKLIWPAPNGVGVVDAAAWEQTVAGALAAVNEQGQHLITSEPPDTAYSNTYIEQAIGELSDVDTTGESYQPIEVTLAEG